MAKAKTVVIDEIHLTFRIRADTPEDGAERVRGALAGEEFVSRLRRAVRAALRSDPELSPVRLAVTR
jgi:hypothetical protein